MYFPKTVLSAVSVKDSEQDFFFLNYRRFSVGLMRFRKVPVITYIVWGI